MRVLTLAVAVAAALGAGQAGAATYVVQARALGFDNALASKVESLGGQVVARYPQIGVAIVQSDDQFIGRAARVTQLLSTTRDRELKYDIPEAVPMGFDELVGNPPNSGDNDFLFDLQWGMDAINAPEAWNAGFRGAGATVAVLDSGLNCGHPDLAANNLAGLNTSFVAGEAVCTVPAFPAFNHGTHVAGIIAAADNGTGVIGVAPQAKFFSVKVLSAFTGSGDFAGILQGIMYATEHGADVINMSLGVSGGLPIVRDTRELINAVERATQFARRNNTTIIAAAGNDGIDFDHAVDADGNRLMSFPAGAAGILGISATAPVGWAVNPAASDKDLPTTYTNTGRSLVEVAAPGGDSAYPGNENCTIGGITRPCWVFDLVLSSTTGGWAWAGGTSMASPHAAGVAALIIGAHGGPMTPGEVEASLLRSADERGTPGMDPVYGRGRVNAQKAVQ